MKMLLLLSFIIPFFSCNSSENGEVDYGEMTFLADLSDGRKAYLRRSIEVDEGFDTVIVKTYKVGTEETGLRDSSVETVKPFLKPPVPRCSQ